MTFEIRADIGQVVGIYAGLMIFGLLFNQMTGWIEKNGYLEGFTSLLVAFGTVVTLAPFAILSFELALMVVGGFIASGSPMILGSIVRYIQRREQAKQAIARLKAYDNHPEILAR